MDNETTLTDIMASPMERGIGRFEYQPDSPIADGGFATVYWARDRVAATDVALKILKPEHEGNQRLLDAFFHDPRVARRLDHPNIIKILSVGDPAAKPYFFAMEYCGMGDLRRMIHKSRRLPIAKGLRVAMAICDALQYCHTSGLAHGDIKASNILFRNSETPVLSDFGNAVDHFRRDTDTHDQENVGSPPYMGPEIWEQRGCSPLSDLYSLGVLLYYILTGVLPFSGQSPDELKKMHLFTVPSPPSKWRSGILKPLDEVVLALLEKRPGDRMGSAGEVQSLLRQIYAESYDGVDAVTDAQVRILFDRKSADGITVTKFPFRIGKGESHPEEGNHLVVGNSDPYVSRCHAIIERFEEGFFFIDVSTNGSWVNGTRLYKQSIELCKDNAVLLGKETSLVITISGNNASERDHETAFLGSWGTNSQGMSHGLKAGIAVGAGLLILVIVANLIPW